MGLEEESVPLLLVRSMNAYLNCLARRLRSLAIHLVSSLQAATRLGPLRETVAAHGADGRLWR